MDLDLAQVRAFVAAADELHFGRAAEVLYLSQQALSKRVRRLEETLGVTLFARDTRSVRLTEPGRRFLDPARRVLAAGDAAVATARQDVRPLRLEVWGGLYQPTRTIREVLDRTPECDIELGTGRGLASAVSALHRDEIDAAFGRVHPWDRPWPSGLAHRLVRLEPVAVVLSARHPLAGAQRLRPADLRGTRLWFPAAAERIDFLHRFAAAFGIETEFSGVNLGADAFADHLREAQDRVSIIVADARLPDLDGLRLVSLVEPVPLYAWSLVWPAEAPHPGVETLLRGLSELGRRDRWLDYDPARHWLPENDSASLRTRDPHQAD